MVIVNYDLDFDEFIHSHIVADLCPLDVNSYLYYSVHEKWNAFRVPLENVGKARRRYVNLITIKVLIDPCLSSEC